MDVSFQLYSAREHTSWADTFALLAKLGYTQVEGFGGVYQNVEETRDLMAANGLTMPSGHFFPISQFEDNFDTTIATAKTLGIKKLFCPAPEDDLRNGGDLAAWVDLGQRLETAAKRVQDAGLSFGWHNHHWEFIALPDGEIPMQVILDTAPSIEWEMDVAWVVRGGADPMSWIDSYKDRITAAHVKDIATEGECEDEDGWADVGHGTMDWASLTTALRGAGVSLFVMEHDKPSDTPRFAERSIATFKTF
ncbi:sugar phosphate isomerase/epimerase family protein [Tritonibacter horizontis]|uniref:Xylose isomerase-like TIM barrel n=1 Tax=Tritonibacter horizontis TaxID=1768241 RepID=A0A132BTB8_9RHOB|nr:sugar phosphate isomerase/epimerase [Tritonibacter horizontis]KUP91631.1 xylose isomerase-like TIM barrel [Tritonibacter horizontis]